MQVTAPERPDFSKRKFLEKERKRMEFVSFSRGIMGPLGFHAAGDVLDRPFLNQGKIIAILPPDTHSPCSLCSRSLALSSHCLREKQEVNQKQEPGEMARVQGVIGHPKHCYLQDTLACRAQGQASQSCSLGSGCCLETAAWHLGDLIKQTAEMLISFPL